MTEYTPGMILVKRISYSMTFYDFYKVERVTAKQVKCIKLRKKYTGTDSFRPIVTPTSDVDNRSPDDMYLTMSKDKAEWKLSVYDASHVYQEDHLD